MAQAPKITTGANDRPRNESIGQSAPGLPDDSSTAPEVDETQAARIGEKLTSGAHQPRTGQGEGAQNVDEVPPGTPGAAENICRRCSGSGRIDGAPCLDCAGTGIVTTPVGGGG